MNIDRNNYEAYFLDFIEGRLTSEQEEVLHRFLKFNPDLEAELRSFELHEMDAPQLSYKGKSALKKEQPAGTEVNDANFEMYCVAYLEGDLEEKQQSSFEAYLADNPGRLRDLEVFKSTHLEAVHVSFPLKSGLKRSGNRLLNWRIMVPVAAAATIALLVFFRTPDTLPTIEIASVAEPEQLKEEPVVEKEEKSAETKAAQATFNMVRKTNSPVPVSDFKERQQQSPDIPSGVNEQKGEHQSGSGRITALNLGIQQKEPFEVQYDQIHQEIIEPPTINSSSLSVLALAKYRAQKASEIMEEEDALLWNLASSGLKELNRITGSETRLVASRDEEGAISGIRFKSRFLNVTAPISRDE